jgi:uncharacterized protein YwqG
MTVTMTRDQAIDVILQSSLAGRAQELIPLLLPSFRIIAQSQGAAVPIGSSKLYGNPDLPDGLAWPDWTTYYERFGERDPETNVYSRLPPGIAHLSFLAQINLGELSRLPEEHLLPPMGVLSFFYYRIGNPWGRDPRDALAWRVLYFQPRELSRRPAPTDVVTDTEERVSFQLQYALPAPGWRDLPALDEDEADIYEDEIQNNLDPSFDGRLLGYPKMLQHDDPREQCQFCTHGLDCRSVAVLADPRVPALRPGVKDWIMLLQLCMNTCYLSFWIRQQDLADRRFDRIWIDVQVD